MIIKFNNNNIWELVDGVVFYKRLFTPHALSTLTVDKVVNEDEMIPMGLQPGKNFNYHDWKAFHGEEMLRKIASDYQLERYALPMIYYAIYVLGLTDMKRDRSTKYTFNRRP